MSKPPCNVRSRGFSLIELLVVVSIMSIVASFAMVAFNNMSKSTDFTADINGVTQGIEQARAAAMAGNTYVWIGFIQLSAATPGNVDGIDEVLMAAVYGKNGQSTDLAAGHYTPLFGPKTLKSLDLVKPPFDASVLQSAGRQAADDLSASQLDPNPANCQFSQTVGSKKVNGKTPVFTELLQFNPLGEARIKSTSSNWIEIGMESWPWSKSPDLNPKIAIVQVSGFSGKVRIFRR